MNGQAIKHILVNTFFLILWECLAFAPGLAQAQMESPGFTIVQATRGQSAYVTHCAACHGQNLGDGAYGPALEGGVFLQRWGGKSLAGLFTYTIATMPPAALGKAVAECRYR